MKDKITKAEYVAIRLMHYTNPFIDTHDFLTGRFPRTGWLEEAKVAIKAIKEWEAAVDKMFITLPGMAVEIEKEKK